MSPAHRPRLEPPAGQGRVLDEVTGDCLWLQRTPAHSNAGLTGLGDGYHSWAQHLCRVQRQSVLGHVKTIQHSANTLECSAVSIL